MGRRHRPKSQNCDGHHCKGPAHQDDLQEELQEAAAGIIDKILHCRKFLQPRNYQKLENEFAKAKTDEARAYAMLKCMANLSLLPYNKVKNETLIEGMKSAEKSSKLRNAGNAMFATEKQKALELYNKSIAVAPHPTTQADQLLSVELAYAYANRSALLLAVKEYVPCLGDIEQAFAHHYPNDLHYKLWERKGKCLQYLDRFQEAAESFKNAREKIKNATTLSADKAKSLVMLFCQLQIKSQNNIGIRTTFGQRFNQDASEITISEMTCGQNPKVPSIADCLQIEESKEMGRLLQATKDIKVGDWLIVEKPYASVLIPSDDMNKDNRYTHCHHCLQRHIALIPCKLCSLAMYCSDRCRTTSWDVYHHIECAILGHLYRLGFSHVPLLTLRLLLTACHQYGGLRGLYNQIPLLDEQRHFSVIAGFNSDWRYESDDYVALHELARCSESLHITALHLSACAAVCLMNCLDVYTTFFSEILPSGNKKPDPNWKLFAAGLMVRYVQIININGRKISEIVKYPDGLLDTNFFGGGVYTCAGLINHSCHPNVSQFYVNGNAIGFRALTDIKKDDQIFMSYQCHYSLKDLQERIEWLKNYCITCRCLACKEDWPQCAPHRLESISRIIWKCTECGETLILKGGEKLFCPKCPVKYTLLTELQRNANAFVTLLAKFTENGTLNSYNALPDEIAKLKKITKMPNDIILMWEDGLKEYFTFCGNSYDYLE